MIADSRSAVSAQVDVIYDCLALRPARDYRETWRQLAGNELYLTELRLAAARLVRKRRLPAADQDDLVQEALVILCERLRHRGDLGFNPCFGRERFLHWLRAVVRRHCDHALRRPRMRRRCSSAVNIEWAADSPSHVAWQIEFADAVDSLDKQLREVLLSFGRLGSVQAVAQQLGLSTTTAWRRFRAAAREVRERCDPFTQSGHLPGVGMVIKKW